MNLNEAIRYRGRILKMNREIMHSKWNKNHCAGEMEKRDVRKLAC